jgi:D-glycero-beta-D-manno-heptose-7-phosphate kinase
MKRSEDILSDAAARETLNAMRGVRVLVLGDLMLDRYIEGRADRISPEAPVPVVRVDGESAVPGGASNVALNIRRLGGEPVVCGLVGEDAAGETLRRLLEEDGIGTAGILRLSGRQTTVKTRVVAGRQQVVRVDREERYPPGEDEIEQMLARLESVGADVRGAVIEDYGKGVVCQPLVHEVIRAAAVSGAVTGYDPKDNHALDVAGITLATPNRREAFLAAGLPETEPREDPLRDEPLLRAARALSARWKPHILAVTLGPQGMLLLREGEDPRHVPTMAREVFDVSGAGDTVIAAAVLAMAGGADAVTAAQLANLAAGVTVGKLGAATCSPEELIHFIERAE